MSSGQGVTQIQDGIAFRVNQPVIASGTLPDRGTVLKLDASQAKGGTLTAVLPSAASMVGQLLILKRVDSSANTLLVTGNGSDAIDGQPTQSLAALGSLTILSDGSSWLVAAQAPQVIGASPPVTLTAGTVGIQTGNLLGGGNIVVTGGVGVILGPNPVTISLSPSLTLTNLGLANIGAGQILFGSSVSGSNSLIWDNVGHTLKFAETGTVNVGQYIQKVSTPNNNNYNIACTEFTNSSDPRNNSHFMIGYNISPDGGTPEVTAGSEPELSIAFESFFQIGSNRYCESYLQYGKNSSQLLRPWFARCNRSTDFIEMQIGGNTIAFIDFGNSSTEIGRFASGSLFLGGTTSRVGLTLGIEGTQPGYYFWCTAAAADNHLWDHQAGATTYTMVAVNDAVSSSNTFFTATRSGTTITSIQYAAGTPTNQTSYTIQQNLSTFQATNAGGVVRHLIQNNDNTSAASASRLDIYAGGSAGGDAYTLHYDGTSKFWSSGLANAAGGKFKISAASSFGTNDYVIITQAGVINLANQVFVPAGSAANPSLVFGTTTLGFFEVSNAFLGLSDGTQAGIAWVPSGPQEIFGSGGIISWANSADAINGTVDTKILRNAAHVVRIGGTAHGVTVAHDGTNGTVDVDTGKLILGGTASDIQWGTALVALGGGAAPTLGTIGGTGPAAAAQNSWMQVKDSAGNKFWVPVWK